MSLNAAAANWDDLVRIFVLLLACNQREMDTCRFDSVIHCPAGHPSSERPGLELVERGLGRWWHRAGRDVLREHRALGVQGLEAREVVFFGGDAVACVAPPAAPLDYRPHLRQIVGRRAIAAGDGGPAAGGRMGAGARNGTGGARSGAYRDGQRNDASAAHRKAISAMRGLPPPDEAFGAIERHPSPWSGLLASHGSGAFFGTEPGAGSGKTNERAA